MSDDPQATLREQIRAARVEAGLSRRRLAQLLGIHRNTLSHFEKDGTLSVESFCRLVRHVHVRRITLDGVTYVREDAGSSNTELLDTLAAELRASAGYLLNVGAVATGTMTWQEVFPPATPAPKTEEAPPDEPAHQDDPPQEDRTRDAPVTYDDVTWY